MHSVWSRGGATEGMGTKPSPVKLTFIAIVENEKPQLPSFAKVPLNIEAALADLVIRRTRAGIDGCGTRTTKAPLVCHGEHTQAWRLQAMRVVARVCWVPVSL